MTPHVAIAIETSGKDGSTALCVDGVVVDERAFAQGMRHASGLLAAIDEMFKRHALRPGQLSAVYVSIGPGSFTGLRVGVTAAKVIAMACGCSVVPVPSLLVIAHNAPAGAKQVVVMLNAKAGQVFGERFEREGEMWKSQNDSPGRLIEPAVLLGECVGEVFAMGDGTTSGINVSLCEPSSWAGRAFVVAKLGRELLNQGKAVEAMTLVPLYIRRPEPEEKRLASQN